jgi:hypothetical protein
MIAMNSGVTRAPSLNPVVKEIGSMSFEGNIIPLTWFQHSLLKSASGKPNLVAIVLLSDVVYWYRPKEIREERSGRIVELRQKFHADKLQKHYKDWGLQFGLTVRQIKNAVSFLQQRGLVTREVRASVRTEGGKVLGNVIFIQPVVDAIRELQRSENTLFYDGRRLEEKPSDLLRCSGENLSPSHLLKRDGDSKRSDGEILQKSPGDLKTREGGSALNSATYTEILKYQIQQPPSGSAPLPRDEGTKKERKRKSKSELNDPQVYVKAHAMYQAKWKARHFEDYVIGRPESIAIAFILERLNVAKDAIHALKRFGLVTDAYLADNSRDLYAGHSVLKFRMDIEKFITFVSERIAGHRPHMRTQQSNSGASRRGNELERAAAQRGGWNESAQAVDLDALAGPPTA